MRNLTLRGLRVFEAAATTGSFSRAGRNLVDPELLERVEFLRGPASSLYGSDALAGVVAMQTRDPVDLLGQPPDAVFATGRHNNVKSLLSQGFRGCLADPGTGPGDDGGPSLLHAPIIAAGA